MFAKKIHQSNNIWKLSILALACIGFSYGWIASALPLNVCVNIGFDGDVIDVIQQPDEKLLVWGKFTKYYDASNYYLMRLNPDRSMDTSFIWGTGFNTGVGQQVNTIAQQADGKVLVGWVFSAYQWLSRNWIVRLNEDWSIDESFIVGAGFNNDVRTIAIQPDGKILVWGNFTRYQGIVRNRIARLNADGSLDVGFNPNANNTVYDIEIQPDGQIIIWWVLTTIWWVARNRIARVASNGTLDAFNPTVTNGNRVEDIELQPDGKILIWWVFSTVWWVARSRIARVNANGTLDNTFDPNANNTVSTIELQPDGKILIWWIFLRVWWILRNRMVRLNANGTLDNTFAIGNGFNNGVNVILQQADGNVYVGGAFTWYQGATGHNYETRIDQNANIDPIGDIPCDPTIPASWWSWTSCAVSLITFERMTTWTPPVWVPQCSCDISTTSRECGNGLWADTTNPGLHWPFTAVHFTADEFWKQRDISKKNGVGKCYDEDAGSNFWVFALQDDIPYVPTATQASPYSYSFTHAILDTTNITTSTPCPGSPMASGTPWSWFTSASDLWDTCYIETPAGAVQVWKYVYNWTGTTPSWRPACSSFGNTIYNSSGVTSSPWLWHQSFATENPTSTIPWSQCYRIWDIAPSGTTQYIYYANMGTIAAMPSSAYWIYAKTQSPEICGELAAPPVCDNWICQTGYTNVGDTDGDWVPNCEMGVINVNAVCNSVGCYNVYNDAVWCNPLDPVLAPFCISPSGWSVFVVRNGKVWINNNTPVYEVDVVGAVRSQGMYTVSDARVKDTIKKIDDALGKIRAINGYTFTWKSTGQPDMWVLAQEIEKVFADAVSTDPSGTKTVQYTALIAPILEALKELHSIVDEQTHKAMTQSEKITELEKNIQ